MKLQGWLGHCCTKFIIGACAFSLPQLTLANVASDDWHALQSFDFIHETYFVSNPASRGLTHRLEWTQVRARLNDHWLAEIGDIQMINQNVLDETYLQFEDQSTVVRAGRLRSTVGLSTWSDMFYNVSSRAPIVRFMPLVGSFSLLNFQSGVSASANVGEVEIKASVADGQVSSRQALPSKLNLFEGRAQISIGNSLVGFDFSGLDRGSFGTDAKVYGLDFRGAQGRWSWMGEWQKGTGGGTLGEGFYGDLSYRLVHPVRPQLGIRIEGYKSGGLAFNMATVGIKVIPVKQLTLNLNYGFDTPFKVYSGSSSAPFAGFKYGSTLSGWSFQAMWAIRMQL
ncbi:hypothetical protein BH11ARM1_BH11ARM1_07340 [soil metagenome]